MCTNSDPKPDGSLDPEAVREASASTFKELRAKLDELRLVENMERLAINPQAPQPTIQRQNPPESLDPR